MAFDLAGIHNENEFYTHHYLTTLLEQDVKGVLAAWELREKEKGTPAPHSGIRKLAKRYFTICDDLAREKDPIAALETQNAFLIDFFIQLGYPIAVANIEISEDISIPVITQLSKSNGVPQLWILSILDPGNEQGDPLNCFWQDFQFQPGKKHAEETIEDFITRNIFTLDEPPRWLIVATLGHIVLIDRTKWHDKRLLSFDLGEIFARRETTTFQALAVLLHKESICPDDGIPLLDSLDESSHKHAYAVSEDLKYSLREAIELLGNEVLYSLNGCNWQGAEGIGKYKKLYDTDTVEFSGQLTKECLRYMYRLLFLFYIEARPELEYAPMKSDEYRLGYSLDSLRELEMVNLTTEESRNGYYIQESMDILFKVIFNGFGDQHAAQMHTVEEGTPQYHTFTLSPLNSHLFDPEHTPIIGKAKLRNGVLQEILRLMSLSRPRGRRERRGRISYTQLGINQLGAVYEALLSYSGFLAKTDLYEVKKAGESYNELQQAFFVKAEELPKYTEEEKVFTDEGKLKKYEKGTFIYRLAGRDREKSASYYTPEVLTKCLVKYALKELLKNKNADDILKLAVCEAAMGSAAFINEVINQLSEAYLQKKQEETGTIISHDKYPQILQQVKMYIAAKNVYGVDLNPVAVELAEISLWLNTIHKGAYVPWFGMQLVCGNSLVGARRQVFDASLLGSKKKGSETWLESVPERVKPGEKRSPKGVYHFLLPDNGMADYNDPVIKQMAGDKINHIKNWRKEFTNPFSATDIELLKTLSAAIDKLWLRHTEQQIAIRKRTSDTLTVWGQPKPENPQPPTTTQWKDKVYFEEMLSQNVRNSSPFRRLKLVMDYWCALWFWPIEKAELLPSRDEYLMDLQLVLEGNVIDIMAGSPEQTTLFPETQPKQEALKLVDEFGFVNVDELMQKIERLKVVNELAERYRFLHWELQFADVFAERGGFDLIVGNPPWTRARKELQPIVSDYNPLPYIKDYTAAMTYSFLENEMTNLNIRIDILSELSSLCSLKSFLSSVYYPAAGSSNVNLYKCFIEHFLDLCPNSVMAWVHDGGIYNEPAGHLLRAKMFSSLKFCFKFINQLNHFPEEALGHAGEFALSVFSKRESIQFDLISFLFHPIQIHQSLFEGKSNLELPKLKDKKGWIIKGHPERVINVNATILKEIVNALGLEYDYTQTIIPSAYSKSIYDIFVNISGFDKLSHSEKSLSATEDINKTNAQRSSAISTDVGFRQNLQDVIYSSPIIYVGTPFFKTPNRNCTSKGDYSNVDLAIISSDYFPRTIFKFNQKLFENSENNEYRFAWRNWVSPSNERTLICAIIPPKVRHVNSLISARFTNLYNMVTFAGLSFSIAYDFLIRIQGLDHIWAKDILRLPFPISMASNLRDEIIVNTLRLNCITNHYEELWNKCHPNKMTWNNKVFAKSHIERRSDLVKLDVLSAIAIGFKYEDLVNIYLTSFPILENNEENTYYCRNGQIIFTQNRNYSNVGLSRSEWEKVKTMKSGTVEQEIEDDTMPGGPVKRTIVYQAPFDKCNREQDYEVAWHEFEKRGIVSQSSKSSFNVQGAEIASDQVRIIQFKRGVPLKGERYTKFVPRWELDAAAGQFDKYQTPEVNEWLELGGDIKITNRMFVGRADGKSMEPMIPDGSLCLFEKQPLGSLNNKIALVISRNPIDPETGGKFVIKQCKISQSVDDFGEPIVQTRLESINPEFKPIILDSENDVAGVARFIGILEEEQN